MFEWLGGALGKFMSSYNVARSTDIDVKLDIRELKKQVSELEKSVGNLSSSLLTHATYIGRLQGKTEPLDSDLQIIRNRIKDLEARK